MESRERRRPSTSARAPLLSAPTLALPALFALAALPYLPALAAGFVWDDGLHIVDNARIDGFAAVLEYFGRAEGLYYRPLIFLSFAAENAAWGRSALAFHLTNVLLHGLNTMLVCIAARRTGVGPAAAFLGAAVFALHPLQSEAVAYVAGRTDLVMTAAALIAFLAVVGPPSGASLPLRRGLVAALATAVSILSKETGYALALLLPWLAWTHASRWRERLLLAGPAVLVSAALLGLRPAPLASGSATFLQPLRHGGQTAGEYLALLLWPGDLQIDRLVSAASDAGAFAAVVLAIALLIGVAFGLRQRGCTADWVAWTAAFYLPAANALPIYPQIAARALFVPEHNLYAPLAGIGVLFALAAVRLRQRLAFVPARAWTAAAAMLLCLWGARTWARGRDWHDDLTLFRAAAGAGSVSPRVWFNLGNALMQARQAEDAGVAYRRATVLAPGDAEAWTNLGVALQTQGALDEALAAYERALALRPSPRIHRNLGTLHRARGDAAAAQRAFDRAAQPSPDEPSSGQAPRAPGG